ncbi:nuclear transport factor 2 family protein [Microbacterium sp. 10M-3C3]|jgi:ketosteroid isomerase-like protein|uniref:nuclear transport factor 2 family protein n=1 Tax=Microbacterium sp. 10M-3C3 TaxID=2483401 RepID=UPI000F63A06B|nr:nuclear transport factor 2 family protein [Microbacterium sp. 10M-3C3]
MDKKLEQSELPEAARAFVDGWQGRDADKVAALFADDAVVSDEGRTHRGAAEIRGWIDGSINLFTTTLTFLGAREVEDMVGASYRLEGDFPGGVVDLEYQFRLDADGRIRQLDFDAAA